jgi:large subunit ribosomal protein L31e
MAEKKSQIEEKIFTIPLRGVVNRANSTERSVAAVREIKRFVSKHMKTDEVKVSTRVNETIWKSGLKSLRGKIKVKVHKEDGVATARMVDELVLGKEEKAKKTEGKEEAKTGKSKETEAKSKEESAKDQKPAKEEKPNSTKTEHGKAEKASK